MVSTFEEISVDDGTQRPAPPPVSTIEFRPEGSPPLVVESFGPRELFALEADIRALEQMTLEPNAQGSADFLLAACHHFPENAAPSFIAVFFADDSATRRLVGLFPMARTRFDLTGSIRRSWTHSFSTFGAPLIAADMAETVVAALLPTLGAAPNAHSALCLSGLTADGPVAKAIQSVAASLGLKVDLLSRHQRAALSVPPASPEAYNRRMKTRSRQRRRLSERGALTFRIAESYDEIRAALETFLAMEARGWKGANGTALVQNPAHSNFTRAMVWSAAQHGNIRIAELQLDGVTIASTVMQIAGTRGFLWKIAYDESYAAFSPGVLLILDLTQWLIEDGLCTLVDSCTEAGNPMMEALWSERIEIADLMISLRPEHLPAYRATLARERLRRDLRRRVKIIYNRFLRQTPAA